MTLNLDYLSSLPGWSGSADFNLDNIRRVMRSLGDPQDKLRVVHIAGTNGKGSVAVGVASCLGACGARVGLTTSPNLVRINERIVIDGLPVEDSWLDDYAGRVRAAMEDEGIQLSYFETIIAISMLGFLEEGLDYAVFEVGLGGRLDATNIVKRPLVSCVTTIDLDHQHILGDTLSEIAGEKAAIMKSGVPCVVGRLPDEAMQVVKRTAEEVSAPLLCLGKDFTVAAREDLYEFTSNCGQHTYYRPSLLGPHQAENSSLALQIALVLGMPLELAKRGLEAVFWPARLERLNVAGRPIILDCAHNTGGFTAIRNFLHQEGHTSVDLCIGFLQTKNWQSMLELISPMVDNFYLLEPESERAVLGSEVMELLSCNEVRIRNYESDYDGFVREQILSAGVQKAAGKPLLIAGSIYMVGKLRNMLSPELPPLWCRGQGSSETTQYSRLI